MRDLHQILKLCATEDAMDYCSEFDEIKSILEYCNKHLTPFKKLGFQSGNSLIINDMTRRFQELFIKNELICPESYAPKQGAEQKLRKILIFLLVNTDITFKYNLRQDTNITHVVEICPLLPKFLTIALIWELQLDKFFFEMLSYTPCWFAYRYFEAVNESLNFIEDPNRILVITEQVVTALLNNLTQSDSLELELAEKKIIHEKFHESAIILLRRFNTPDARKLEHLKRRKLDIYWGYSVFHLLQLTLHAFDSYMDEMQSLESTLPRKEDFDVSIYHIGEKFLKRKPHQTAIDKSTRDIQLQIIFAILNTLENNVMTIKMDSFIEWAEVDKTPNETLQQAVGKLAHKVGERMAANKAFTHNVQNVVKSIEIVEQPIEEIVKIATIGEILRSLDQETLSPDEKQIWYNELFKRGALAMSSDECQETIKEHKLLITPMICTQIMDYLKLNADFSQAMKQGGGDNDDSDMDVDDDDKAELFALVVESLNRFSIKDLYDLLIYQTKHFGINGFNGNANRQPTTDFEQRTNEFLNKFTADLGEHFEKEFLCLCFENPLRMWKKFFHLGCQNKENVKNFCAMVTKTSSFSTSYIDELIRQSLGDPTEYAYFPEMICELYFLVYRKERQSDFIAKYLNENMKSHINLEKYKLLLPIIKSLNLITNYSKELNFDDLTSPTLAIVALVADVIRWDLHTYDETSVEILSSCIKFIQDTLKKFLPVASEKGRKWLSNKVNNYMPITQFYFQKLSQTRDQQPLPFDRFLFPDTIADQTAAIELINKINISCTATELKWLVNNDRLRPFVTVAMQQLAVQVKSIATSNAAIQNFRYCLTKYALIVNEVLLPNCVDAEQTMALLRSVLQLIGDVPVEIYGQVFMDFECLLRHMLMKSAGLAEEIGKLKTEVFDMPDCAGKTVFLQAFNADALNI